MKLTFLGAAHEVTGSCTLLEACGHRILIDFGMEQGTDIYQNCELPVAPGELDAVLLTHAHIDHSGKLPVLAAGGFHGSIYATGATVQLCGIMLMDSAHIQEFEAEWRNRKAQRSGEDHYLPMYTAKDVEKALQLFVSCHYNRSYSLFDGISIRFLDTGHLLGSSSIEITVEENGTRKVLLFSGDVGNIDRPLIRNPQKPEHANFVVIESTYGDRLHGERKNSVSQLTDVIQRTFDRGGNVVIPSFAVGRTQELLYLLREIKKNGMVHGHPDFPVWVDSPLAVEATSIYDDNDEMMEYYDDRTLELLRKGEPVLRFPGLSTSVTSDDSKAINADEAPKVILSASGMCEAGRIRHHLKHNLWRPESTVLFVGYQAEGSLGRSLVDGTQEVKLFGETIAVKAEIGVLPGISGHADKNGLLNWIRGFTQKPQKVFVNHGEDKVCDVFAETLHTELGLDAFAPYSGTVFDLLTGEITVRTEGIPVVRKVTANPDQPDGRAPEAYTDLEKAGQELTAFLASCRGRANRQLRSMAAGIRALIEKNR